MPLDLVLIRHGESEGNVAVRLSKRGDNSAYQGPFGQKHSSKWRLTTLGQEQARQAGAWIHANTGDVFDKYFCSEYDRAKETAALLGLPRAWWYLEYYLRERDWGDLDTVPPTERGERFAESMKARTNNRFFWTPPNGESMPDVCLRVDRFLYMLRRICDKKQQRECAVVVCHGDVMWALQVRIERMPLARYLRLNTSEDPLDEIHNGQVIHYSCRHPDTDKSDDYFAWKRSICPWDTTLSRNEWEPVKRRAYSNADILDELQFSPRHIDNTKRS